MSRNLVVTSLVSVLMAGFVLIYTALTPTQAQQGMIPVTGPTVPSVKGYSEGQEILFIHTEASDPGIARILTDMMGSPVLVVPSLARAPEAMLAHVYVFKNGIKGEGPLGFQPDVFDHPPGTAGYSPLRALNLVTWKDEQAARELRSAAEVKEAEARGEVTIERPGVVINMPLLTWPGGER
ncbi:MAG: hypothetical protein D6736_16715 [Nitrospinota bacterium]|nr:MAG: hypothetical protein D6736_16715 [Nitrospinota bacterium]